MGTVRCTSVGIDGDSLKILFQKRGLNMNEVSSNIGYDACYISRATRTNKMSKPAINLLDSMYNIKFSDYEKREEEESPVEIVPIQDQEKEETRINEEMANQLYQIIYSAVYQAVKKAWAE